MQVSLDTIRNIMAQLSRWLTETIDPPEYPFWNVDWRMLERTLRFNGLSEFADRFRAIASLDLSQEKLYQEEIIQELGVLYLITRLFTQYWGLPIELRRELNEVIGWQDPELAQPIQTNLPQFTLTEVLDISQSSAFRPHHILIKEVYIVRFGHHWTLRNATGSSIVISKKFRHIWALYALCGGQPIDVGGNWDGKMFIPFYAITDNGVTEFSATLPYRP